MQNKLEEYQALLDDWGIKDYQVHNLHVPFSKIFYAFIHCLTVWLLASIPNLLLNAPVGIAAYYWAYEGRVLVLISINLSHVIVRGQEGFESVESEDQGARCAHVEADLLCSHRRSNPLALLRAPSLPLHLAGTANHPHIPSELPFLFLPGRTGRRGERCLQCAT